jgi:hypothetical protein
LTGLTTPPCVLFTAGDAYMRDFALAVPRDCAAAADAGQHRQALTFMSRFFAADIRDPPSPASLAPAIAHLRPVPAGPLLGHDWSPVLCRVTERRHIRRAYSVLTLKSKGLPVVNRKPSILRGCGCPH